MNQYLKAVACTVVVSMLTLGCSKEPIKPDQVKEVSGAVTLAGKPPVRGPKAKQKLQPIEKKPAWKNFYNAFLAKRKGEQVVVVKMYVIDKYGVYNKTTVISQAVPPNTAIKTVKTSYVDNSYSCAIMFNGNEYKWGGTLDNTLTTSGEPPYGKLAPDGILDKLENYTQNEIFKHVAELSETLIFIASVPVEVQKQGTSGTQDGDAN